MNHSAAHIPIRNHALILGTFAVTAGWLFKLGNRFRAAV